MKPVPVSRENLSLPLTLTGTGRDKSGTSQKTTCHSLDRHQINEQHLSGTSRDKFVRLVQLFDIKHANRGSQSLYTPVNLGTTQLVPRWP